MNVDISVCTAEQCSRLTTLHLCTTCIIELADLLEDVRPILERIDAVIYRMTVTSAPGSGGGGGVAGSRPAMNVDAYLLKAHLYQLPTSAHAEAMDNPMAGQTLYMAREWVNRGRDLVWGPEDKRVYGRCGEPIWQPLGEALVAEEGTPHTTPCAGQLVAHPDDATVKCPECSAVHVVAEILDRLRKKLRGEPAPPSAIRAYLQRRARVTVSKFDIENWVKRGKIRYVLDRVGVGAREQRLYYPGDVLTVAQETRARRRC